MDLYFNRTDSSWTVHAPAKINLFFEVYGKRDDGFHEIASVALPVRLFDTLVFEPLREERIRLDCYGGGPDVPTGDDNIVIRALRLYRQRAGVTQGVRIRLFKRIPSQAGLGGGSSDAAAALLAAQRLWPSQITQTELLEMAAEIGSDCPIFFHRGASLSRGRGERIKSIRSISPLHFVLFKPIEGLSTAGVYAECMAAHDGRFHSPEPLIEELKNGSPAGVARGLLNRLEEPARRLWPRFEAVKEEMNRLGCLTVRMSGSGTAFYGLCHNAGHARRIAAKLRSRAEKGESVFAVAGL